MDANKILNLKTFLSKGTYPDVANKACKRNIRRLAASFEIIDGILKRKVKLFKKTFYADIVKTEVEKREVFDVFHNSNIGGHGGKSKTRDKIAEKYYWPGLSKDVETWIKECEICQRHGSLKKVEKKLTPIKTSGVWDLLGMDLVGPLTQTKNGNRYIMTVTDLYSKWPMAYAIPSKEAIHVATCLINVFSIFGFPRAVLSDNGSEFCNELNDTMFRILGVERRKTAVYHPECNGQAENTNRNLKRKLVKVINENQDNWDTLIDTTLFSLRTERQTTIKFTPFEVMFGGRQPLFPVKESKPIDQILEEKEWEDLGVELDRRQKEMDRIVTEIKKNTEESQRKQVERREKENILKRRPTNFKIGDKVWLYDNIRPKKKGGSLAAKYRGPCQVIDTHKSGNVKLLNENGIPLIGWQKPQFIKTYIEKSDCSTAAKRQKLLEEKSEECPTISSPPLPQEKQTMNEEELKTGLKRKNENEEFDPHEVALKNEKLKQQLFQLYENGELAKMVDQSKDTTNPFMNKNWSGYSGFAVVQKIHNDHPALWEAINILQRNELSGFAHTYLNEKFPTEDLDFGTTALNRLQYIEALIAKDVFSSGEHVEENNVEEKKDSIEKLNKSSINVKPLKTSNMESTKTCENLKQASHKEHCQIKVNNNVSFVECATNEDRCTKDLSPGQTFDKICSVKPRNNLVAKPFNLSILDRHIKDIQNNCLSDEVIDAYLIALKTELKETQTIGIIPCALISQIVTSEASSIGRLSDKAKDRFFSNEVIISIYNKDHHWNLLVIYPKNKLLLLMNPLGEPLEQLNFVKNAWSKYMVDNFNDDGEWLVTTQPHVKQTDSISCGVFCLKFAECILRKEDFPVTFSTDDVKQYRRNIGVKLISAGANGDWCDIYCRICGMEDPPKNKFPNAPSQTEWVQCSKCSPPVWFHLVCKDLDRNQVSSESSFNCNKLQIKEELEQLKEGHSIIRNATSRMRKCCGCVFAIENKTELVVARKERRAKRGKSIHSKREEDFVVTIGHYHVKRKCLRNVDPINIYISKDVELKKHMGLLGKNGINVKTLKIYQ